MKKVLPILMALFFISPVNNVLAENIELLNISKTFINNNPPVRYELKNVANVKEVEWNGPSTGRVNIDYFDEKNIRIASDIVSGNSRKSVDYRNVSYVVLNYMTANVNSLFRIRLLGEEYREIDYIPVTELEEVHTFDSVNLKWKNPETPDFEQVIIKVNDVVKATLPKNVENYYFEDLSPETSYKIDVLARYSDKKLSEPATVIFTTKDKPPEPVAVGDVLDLTADVEHNRVDLSWVLPDSEKFKHVNIYRETLSKSFIDKILGMNTAMAATPIFETNGTYFNDLTVKPETKYEYLLTTTSTEGLESDGVSKTVTTLKKPDPEIEGGGYEKDPETGDFTYTWTKPTTGKVKVMIGGTLHATVEASNGKIIIPSADMKFTIFGKPDVQLIPVDEEGNEGKPVKPPSGGGNGGENGGGVGDSEMPFSGSDLIKATFDFIKILGPIIILILIIRLTPRLINVIRNTIKNKGVDSNAR